MRPEGCAREGLWTNRVHVVKHTRARRRASRHAQAPNGYTSSMIALLGRSRLLPSVCPHSRTRFTARACNNALFRGHRTSCRSLIAQPTRRGVASVTPKAAALPTTWIDRAPAKLRPYLYLTRIDKPIGTLLLFYPCSKYVRIGLVQSNLVKLLQLGQLQWPRTPWERPSRHH